MSKAIQGHGDRTSFLLTPRCKCGWAGEMTEDFDQAKAQFEGHKTQVRRTMGEPRHLRLIREA